MPTQLMPNTHQQTNLSPIEIHTGYVPGVIGWVGHLHGVYYAKAWGSGAGFEILAQRDMCDFMEKYDPQRDLMLSAHADEHIIGTIAILGQPQPEGVQLRFFIVDPAYHGRGAGSRLLDTALDWCRTQGHAKVFLWTVDELPQSRHLYEKAGFHIIERHWDDRYTVPRDALKMQLTLPPQ
jgi:GNAT superfamily N-acetyltransferase